MRKFPVSAPEGVLWVFEGAAVSTPQRGLETMQFVRFKTEEEDQMKRRTLSMMCVVILFGIGLTASLAMADEDDRLSVSVAFGRGLNTAQAGNSVNHVILPDHIKVTQGGVVHFLVAGFHQPVVYNPGKEPDDVVVPGAGTFINDPTNRFYLGINPAGGPLGTAATANPSNAQNRVESVSFPASAGVSSTGVILSEKAEPGVYLVICNVRGHFLDGMFAFIKVKGEDDQDDKD